MAIWPLWVALALGLALTCQGAARRGLFIVAGGLLAMQLIKLAPVGLHNILAGFLWVTIGGDAIRRHLVTSGCLLVLSGLCYFGAEVSAAPWDFLSFPAAYADAFGVAALAGYWHAGRSDRMGKGRRLGVDPGRGADLAGGGGSLSVAQKAGR